jgi:hypothetical protein
MDVSVKSFYNSDIDFFPSKVTKKIKQGDYSSTEEITVTEVRLLKMESDFNWDLNLVDLQKDTLVSTTKLFQNKNVQHVVYDGKVFRDPTKKEIEENGKKFNPAINLPQDNARNNSDKVIYFYLIPALFFLIAIVLLFRKWKNGRNSRT